MELDELHDEGPDKRQPPREDFQSLKWCFRSNSLWRWRLLALFCLMSILLNLAVVTQFYYYEPPRPQPPPIRRPHHNSDPLAPHSIDNFEKPKDFRIVGLVFAGRRNRLSILDCYLQRNLAHNGGFLDEVIFELHTKDKDDISYIRRLTKKTLGYTLVDNHESDRFDWTHAWDLLQPGIMYIKIDDDIVFFEDTTIPAIVRAKLEYPNALLVSANAMNQAALAWIHHHIGAVRPYLPELEPIPQPHPRPKHDWRASLLPDWVGPEDFEMPDGFYEPPFQGHRWLPARHLNNTDKTPIATTKYAAGTSGVMSWAVGAQQHYSFLEHLENDELWRYEFPKWDYDYMRLSITFIAIWGDDIVAVRDEMPRDDEEFLTKILPKRLGRHVVVDGTAMAVHYAFRTQKDMDSTDLLSRYKAYADENICRRQ